MKILLYSEMLDKIGKSGLGKAIEHQKDALNIQKINYTDDSKVQDYDILHINTYLWNSYCFAKKAKKQGKRIVYHAHSTEEDFRNSFLFSNLLAPLFKKWLIKCYSLGDVLITPTEYSKGLLKNYKGLENKKIYAISNGIDVSFFHEDKTARERIYKEYNLDINKPLLIGIGLYIERKGLLDFVELAKRFPEYQFIWFGYSNPKLSPVNIRKALKTNLSNLIFAGYVDKSKIRDALNACDLFLFITKEETEGIPLIEASACKCPTLIRDIPIFEEFKNDIEIYKAKDLEEFILKIPKIIIADKKKLVEEFSKLAEKRSIFNVSKQLKKVYEEVMKG